MNYKEWFKKKVHPEAYTKNVNEALLGFAEDLAKVFAEITEEAWQAGVDNLRLRCHGCGVVTTTKEEQERHISEGRINFNIDLNHPEKILESCASCGGSFGIILE